MALKNQQYNFSKMKKTFLTFAVLAMTLSFTSCKETTTETTDVTTEEVAEPVAETVAEEAEIYEVEVSDEVATDSSDVEVEAVEVEVNE